MNLKGQTFEEAESTVRKKLKKTLRDPEVAITLSGWRKLQKNNHEAVELKREKEELRRAKEELQRAKSELEKTKKSLEKLKTKPTASSRVLRKQQ